MIKNPDFWLFLLFAFDFLSICALKIKNNHSTLIRKKYSQTCVENRIEKDAFWKKLFLSQEMCLHAPKQVLKTAKYGKILMLNISWFTESMITKFCGHLEGDEAVPVPLSLVLIVEVALRSRDLANLTSRYENV